MSRLIGDRKKVVYRLYREEGLSPVAAADAGNACDPTQVRRGQVTTTRTAAGDRQLTRCLLRLLNRRLDQRVR